MTARTLHHTSSEQGSVLVILAVATIFVGAVATFVAPMIQTGGSHTISANQAQNAYYLAEGGFRFLVSQYLHTANEDGDTTADDDKMRAMMAMDGQTYTLPGSMGTYTLTIRPYWFTATRDYNNARNVSVVVPGTLPTEFDTAPETGLLKIGNEAGAIPYTNGSINTSTKRFSLRFSSSQSLEEDDPVYFALDPDNDTTITEGDALVLETDNPPPIPPINGYISVDYLDSSIAYYTYDQATYNDTDEELTLTNITYILGDRSNSDIDIVAFKKTLAMTSQGRTAIGDETATRSLNYYAPVTDSELEEVSESTPLQTKKELRDNLDWSNNEASIKINTYTWAGGADVTSADVTHIKNSFTRAYPYRGVFINFSDTDKISDAWLDGNRALNYDLQCKFATYVDFQYAAMGLGIREGHIGLSFLRYRDDFNNVFDWHGWQPWDDDIPSGIKPPDEANQLLLVLWEKQDNNTYRWLAYRNIQADTYVRGNQSQYDGEIVNDGGSLLLRVSEKTIITGSPGVSTRVNEIYAMYGDNSQRYNSRTPNNISYDITSRRNKNEIRASYFPSWPYKRLLNWSANVDRYSLVREGTDRGYDTDWVVNTAVTTRYDASTTGTPFVFQVNEDGSIFLSDYTTPSTGASYKTADIQVNGFGDIGVSQHTYSGYNSSLSFADFAVRFLYSKHLTGGIFNPVMY